MIHLQWYPFWPSGWLCACIRVVPSMPFHGFHISCQPVPEPCHAKCFRVMPFYTHPCHAVCQEFKPIGTIWKDFILEKLFLNDLEALYDSMAISCACSRICFPWTWWKPLMTVGHVQASHLLLKTRPKLSLCAFWICVVCWFSDLADFQTLPRLLKHLFFSTNGDLAATLTIWWVLDHPLTFQIT